MPDPRELAETVAAAKNWDRRITLIRSVPEQFGTGQHAEVYAAIAEVVFRPNIEADFAFVHWRDDYELPPLKQAYEYAAKGTDFFKNVSDRDLANVLGTHPESLRVFRLLLGFIVPEFAEACALVAGTDSRVKITKSTIQSIEEGKTPSQETATVLGRVIDAVMNGRLFPTRRLTDRLRPKIAKPDTLKGWDTVRMFATKGVPLETFLHQRLYGGAFRQLLDATSSRRGNLLEESAAELLRDAGVPFVRTSSHNHAVIKSRFGLTVKPSPDFVVYKEGSDQLRAIMECKVANDGGTARDKASRFRSLRAEATRLGGVPLIAVLSGIGWRRTRDALGPVVRDTDGRTFTPSTLGELLSIEPFKGLRKRVRGGS
jgi:hypothetical protein